MGKSTTARMFREAGVPVWDADAVVHRLYAAGGEGVAHIARLAPAAVRDGAVDRAALSRAIADDADLLSRVEAAIHPLVAQDRAAFLAAQAGAPLVVLDIPLLFETGAEGACDRIAVVSAPAAVQRARALARPGMTEGRLDSILARQLPDDEKRARADFVIDTSQGLEAARRQVHTILRELTQPDG